MSSLSNFAINYNISNEYILKFYGKIKDLIKAIGGKIFNKIAMDDIQKQFTELFDSKRKKFLKEFEVATNEIPTIYCKYSINDIAISLFVSNIWLPNISSPIKHQLLTSIFVGLKPDNFSESDRITCL